MKRIFRRRPGAGTAIALLALVAAVAGAAWAAIPDSGGTIHGCYQKNSGSLRVADSAADCRNGEQPITWNQQGPRGTTGATGPQGPPGPGGEVQTIERVTLSGGETRTLVAAGPLTLTARCRIDVVSGPGSLLDDADVLGSTTEEHTASNGRPPEIGPGSSELARQIAEVRSFHFGDTDRHANYTSQTVSFATPSGTDLTAQIDLGVDTFGRPATCSFSGYVVVRT